MITIDIDLMQQVCFLALECQIDTFFWGPSGIGKSSIIASSAKEFATSNKVDLKFVDLRLADCQPDEWGIPYFTEVNGDKVNRRSRPHWLPSSDFKGLFVLFLDEYPLGGKQERAASMQMLSERILHEYSLPSNTVIFAAGNYDTARFGGSPLKVQEKNRFSHIYVESNKDSFISGTLNDSHSEFKSLLSYSHFSIAESIATSSADIESISSYSALCPRSLTNFKRIFDYVEAYKSQNEDLSIEGTDFLLSVEALSDGLIGKVNTAIYLSRFYQQQISVLDLLEDPDKIKDLISVDYINIVDEICQTDLMDVMVNSKKSITYTSNFSLVLQALKKESPELFSACLTYITRTDSGRSVLKSLKQDSHFSSLLKVK